MCRLPVLFALALAFAAPAAAYACAAASELGALHSQYTALITGTHDTSEATVMNVVDVVRRITDEGAAADVSALARIAADVTHLVEMSRNGPSSQALSPRAHSRHLDNLQKLQSWIGETGCPVDVTLPEPLATTIAATDAHATAAIPVASPLDATQSSLLILLGSVLGLAALTLSGLILSKRRTDTADRRGDKRVTVSIDITFLIAGEIQPRSARVTDLSLTGLKIATTAALPVRTRVTLSMDDLVLPATIVWSNAYFAGLRLSQPLDDETFARLQTP